MTELAIVMSNIGANDFHQFRIELGPQQNVDLLEFIGHADVNLVKDGEILMIFSGLIKEDHEEEIGMLKIFCRDNPQHCHMAVIESPGTKYYTEYGRYYNVEVIGNYRDNKFDMHVKPIIHHNA